MAHNTSSSALRLHLLRRFFRARVFGPAARTLRRGTLAARAWISPENNPFLERALRVEARKHYPLLAIVGVALLALALAAGIYLWWLWRPIVFWPHTPRPSTAPPVQFPPSLGHNLVGFVAILTAGACGYIAFYCTRARAGYLLRQEVVKGTLDSLQLMPIAEERWVWMMSAHPTLLSLLIGAVGLPVYALAVWTQQWSLLDVLGLALVFAAIGHVAPMWQPMMWKGAAKGTTPQKVDWKALQESLRLARAEASAANLSPAQQLEAQRRAARMMSGVDAVPATTPSAGALSVGALSVGAPSAGAPNAAGEASTRKNGAEGDASKGAATASGAGWNRGGCSVWLLFWGGFQFFNAMTRFGGGNPFSALWFNLQQALPANVTGLFGIGLLLSWPLLLGRVLTSPLPFFALVLPPAVLLLPLWIGFARLRTWGLAAQVSASETFWTMRRAREYKGVVAVLWLLGAILFAGYAWPSLILDGALGSILLGAPPTNSWALAAVWTLGLVIAAIVASQLLEAPFTRVAAGGLEAPAAWKQATLGVVRTLGWAITLYFVFCWLGFQSGISRVWLVRLLPVILTVAAFLVADFGTAALQSTLKGGPHFAFRTLRWLWSIGLGLEALLRVFVGAITRSSFQFEQAPHVLLSPFVTLLGLFRADLSPPVSNRAVAWWPASLPTIEWWYGPLLQSVIGLLCLAIAAQIVFGKRTAAEAAPDVAERPRDVLDRVLDALLWPFNAVWNVLRGAYNFFVRLFSFAKSWLLNGNEVVIRRVETFDNPVLTAEVRRKARRSNWTLHWLLALVVEALIFLSLAVPWLVIEFLAFRRIPSEWGQVVSYFTIVVAWMLAGLSVTDGGQAFDRDRANGTLVFLFLTPLQDRAIIAGKALAEFVYAAPLLLTVLPWLLIGCLAAVASGNFYVPLVCGFGVMAVASTLVFAVYIQTLFAVRARKPGEGAAKALLCGILVDGGLLISLALLFNHYENIAQLVMMAGALTVVHCILAFGAWRWTLTSMRKQRYGDVTAAGKTVG